MALMGVMLFIPILLVGLAAYTDRAMSEMQSARRLTEDVRARYLAHSALNRAFLEIVRDRNYRGSGYSTAANYEQGHWDYQIEDKNTDPSLVGQFARDAVRGPLGTEQDDRIGLLLGEVAVEPYAPCLECIAEPYDAVLGREQHVTSVEQHACDARALRLERVLEVAEKGTHWALQQEDAARRRILPSQGRVNKMAYGCQDASIPFEYST